MGRPCHEAWKYFTVVTAARRDADSASRKDNPDVVCNYCSLHLSNAQPARHLVPHLRVCELADPDVKSKFSGFLAKRSSPRKKKEPVFASPTKLHRTTSPTKQPSKAALTEWHNQVALAFYCAGVPHRVIENPVFRKMLLRDREHLTLPSRHNLSEELLETSFEREKAEVLEKLKKQPFLSLVSDGWTNTNGECIINFVVCAPLLRPLFWSSITVKDKVHSGEFMAKCISDVIADLENVVGQRKFSGIVTDNAANMRKMWQILKVKWPFMIFNGCAAHVMNLLIKDVFSLTFCANILSQAVKVAKFIRKRHALVARFRMVQKTLHQAKQRRRALAVPVATRWYTSERCIRSVLHNRDILSQLFSDSELMSRFPGEKLHEALAVVHSPDFWNHAAVVLSFVDPLSKSLAMFERDGCYTSMIYHQFQALRNHTIYKTNVCTVATWTQNEILHIIDKRWQFLQTPSIFAAYLLDPSKPLQNFRPGDARAAVNYLVDLVQVQQDPHRQIHREQNEDEVMSFYRLKESWTEEEIETESSRTPLNWWTLMLDMPNLRQCALRIFSVPTSSAASERNWSVHSFIHTSKRNRLEHPRVRKLAFIYANMGDKGYRKRPYYGQYCLSDVEVESDSDDEECDALHS